MKQAYRAALFCSLLIGMGALFGVLFAFFAKEYADRELKKSRKYRETDEPVTKITVDNGWVK